MPSSMASTRGEGSPGFRGSSSGVSRARTVSRSPDRTRSRPLARAAKSRRTLTTRACHRRRHQRRARDRTHRRTGSTGLARRADLARPHPRHVLPACVRGSLPEPAATVLAGALWGERGTLPQACGDDFQATGTVHVLVTAGLHLGVIAALAGACLGPAHRAAHRGVAHDSSDRLRIRVADGLASPLAARSSDDCDCGVIARACGARAIS